MVKNPLSDEIVAEINELLSAIEEARPQVSSENHEQLDEIVQNLNQYQTSDNSPWAEYHSSVRWGMVRIEFSARLQKCYLMKLESGIKEHFMKKVAAMLADEAFNPQELEGKEGINFIGNAKKAAQLIDSHFPNHGLSVVEVGNGGTVFESWRKVPKDKDQEN